MSTLPNSTLARRGESAIVRWALIAVALLILAVFLVLPLASVLPSAVKATQSTDPWCPSSTRFGACGPIACASAPSFCGGALADAVIAIARIAVKISLCVIKGNSDQLTKLEAEQLRTP